MFWSKQHTCPIEQEDQTWIREMLQWIDTEMFPLVSKQTILPTKSYFNHDFKGVEKDPIEKNSRFLVHFIQIQVNLM